MSKEDEDAGGISDQFLAGFSKNIGSEWPLLGINLMFSQAQIDQLQEACPRNMYQCVMTMLTSWRDIVVTCDGINPWKVLSDACEDVGRCDLAQELLSKVDSSKRFSSDAHSIEMMEERVGGIRFGGHETSDINRIIGQTKPLLDRWAKDRQLLVETSSYKTAWQLLSKKRILIICGNPGDGKTTMAFYLLSRLSEEGFSPAVISNPDIMERYYSVKDKVVFFVDDAFGNPGVSVQLVESWVRASNKISSFIELENYRLILVTRRQVYLSCHLEIEDCECFEDALLDLTQHENQLTDVEKSSILVTYCDNKQVPVTEDLIKESCSSPVSGFPLLCKLYTANPELQKLDDFFKQPLSVLSHQLQMLAKADQKAFCGLIMVLMYDGRLPTNVFDVFEQTDQSKVQISLIKEACQVNNSVPLTSIEEALQSLIGVYVTQCDDFYLFMHDAVFDAVTFVFGGKFPSKILKICSAKFLLRRVRCAMSKSKQQQHGGTSDMIFLPKRLTQELSARFLSDIQKGYLSEVFENPSLYDNQVQKHFMDGMKKLPDEARQHIYRRRDKTSTKKFMTFICLHGMVDLVKCLLDKGMPLTEGMWLCACQYNQTAIVDLFIEKGMDVNTVSEYYNLSALHVAADEGHLDLLKHLLSKGADASVKTTGGIEPITYACRTWNVECVKFLINYGIDPNTTDKFGQHPVHVAAGKGDIELMEFLVGKGADPFVCNDLLEQPLHNAAECDNSDLLNYLLKHGANPNVVSRDGKTPLHFACKKGLKDNVRILLSNGASGKLKDSRGRLAIHEACMSEKDCDEILQMLEDQNNLQMLEDQNNLQMLEDQKNLQVLNQNSLQMLGDQNNLQMLEDQNNLQVLDQNNIKTTSHDTEIDKGNETVHTGAIINKCNSAGNKYHKTDVTVSELDNKYNTEKADSLDSAPVHETEITKPSLDNNPSEIVHASDKGRESAGSPIDILKGKSVCETEITEHTTKPSCDNNQSETTNTSDKGQEDIGDPSESETNFEIRSCVNVADSSGMTPLHYACKHIKDGGIIRVKKLLKMGANIHAIDSTKMQPLLYACDNKSTKTGELLMGHGADIHWRGFNRQSAVHFAVAGNCPELVDLLINCGANVNSVSLFGMRPIHFASRQNAAETLSQVLKLGVNADQQDDAEYTPLFYACLHGNVEIVKLLLENGANPEHMDMHGRTALDMLQLRPCDAEIRRMLLHENE